MSISFTENSGLCIQLNGYISNVGDFRKNSSPVSKSLSLEASRLAAEMAGKEAGSNEPALAMHSGRPGLECNDRQPTV